MVLAMHECIFSSSPLPSDQHASASSGPKTAKPFSAKRSPAFPMKFPTSFSTGDGVDHGGLVDHGVTCPWHCAMQF